MLNQSQQRKVWVTLYLLEQALDGIADYLRDDLPCGEMYVTVSDLTEDQEIQLLTLIGETKQRVAEIKVQFGMDVKVNDLRGMIIGQLSTLWESLHNARPRNLSGYGEVSPELFDTLDPKLMELVNLLNSMSRIVTKRTL